MLCVNGKLKRVLPLKVWILVMKKNLPIGIGVVFLLLIACEPQTTTSQGKGSAELAEQRQKNVAAIEDSINNSHARVASERDDVCPKLLQKEVDRQSIKRRAEVMVDDHCDYYLYPQSGQSLAVEVNDSQIEALLIVPKYYDFANGAYQVTSYDKHVIRLSYNGATYKPERLQYDVKISIN